MRRLRVLCIALLISVIASVMPNAYASTVDAYVKGNFIKVYSSASEKEESFAYIGYAEVVTISDISGGWAKIEKGGHVGFCLKSGLTADEPKSYSISAFVKDDGVLAYKYPQKSAKTVSLDKNDKLTVVNITEDGDWCRVKSGSKYAYIRTEDLSAQKADSAEKTSTKTVIKAYVAALAATVYSEPSVSSKALKDVPFGASLKCVDKKDGWVKVKSASGNVGFVEVKKLTKEDPNKYSKSVYAAKATVSVYSMPSAESKELASVKLAAELKCVAVSQNNKWLRVKNGGEYGYVKASDVEVSLSDIYREAVVAYAMKQKGKDYVYGTVGPDTFDCAGLMKFCYAAIGYDIKRTPYAQSTDTKYTVIKSMDKLEIGDLVFFDTEMVNDEDCDHVGMYIGDGKIIHASQVSGSVDVDSINSGFLYRVFTWGMRIIE